MQSSSKTVVENHVFETFSLDYMVSCLGCDTVVFFVDVFQRSY